MQHYDELKSVLGAAMRSQAQQNPLAGVAPGGNLTGTCSCKQTGEPAKGFAYHEEDAKRRAQVPRAIEAQEKLLCALAENIQRLTQKLEPVIDGGTANAKECDESSPRPQLCMVACAIEGHNDQLHRLANELAVLTALIEL